jgi:hypothetical protein
MRSQSIIPRAGLLGISAIAVMVGSVASPALAASCPLAGQQVAGIEQSMVVDAACIDPDYNETTFKLDKVERKTLVLPDSSNILYTEVTGHFPATRIALPVGITPSPTTASHRITWRFPDKAHWRNRFFQQTYPLPFDILNTVDDRFAFTNGGFTVGITPGNSNVGYRVSAAAAKLAKAYADKLYGNTARIYGYLYGQSGGSAQAIGASEGTTGVWDGIIPVVIATDGLTVHSFQWANLYAIAIPQAKREAIAKAVAPVSGRDIYAGLNEDEIAILNELLSAGFARQALEDMKFTAGFGQGNLGAIGDLDPTYEEDFWSKPGYEGVDPPAWLTAASVDGLATITGVARNGQGTPTSVSFDPATLPKLGSIGAEGLQFHVYAADGTTRITNGQARTLGGNLAVGSLNLNGTNDPVLLAALTDGGKIRITNRALLATAFYPRHTIPENGNPAYDQYRNKDGSFRYAQRPFNIAHFGNVKASGGLRQTGNIKAKTMVIENLVDPSSYPYTAAFYASQVERALGPTQNAASLLSGERNPWRFSACLSGSDRHFAGSGGRHPSSGHARSGGMGRARYRSIAFFELPTRYVEPGYPSQQSEQAAWPPACVAFDSEWRCARRSGRQSAGQSVGRHRNAPAVRTDRSVRLVSGNRRFQVRTSHDIGETANAGHSEAYCHIPEGRGVCGDAAGLWAAQWHWRCQLSHHIAKSCACSHCGPLALGSVYACDIILKKQFRRSRPTLARSHSLHLLTQNMRKQRQCLRADRGAGLGRLRRSVRKAPGKGCHRWPAAPSAYR